jgi:hypothetical protein
MVMLDALDKLGDVLHDASGEPLLRRLILHTCRVGLNRAFVQHLANRIQLPVRAQLSRIGYQQLTPEERSEYGSLDGGSYSTISAYDGEAGVVPEGLYYWPVHKLGPVIYPQRKAARWGLP